MAIMFSDLTPYGSLAAALEAAAAELGIELAATSVGFRYATVASTATGREPLQITAHDGPRRWSIWGESRGCGTRRPQMLISGDTAELADLAKVAAAWRDGVPALDIHELADFVELSGRYEVPDDSVEHYIAAEWGYQRKDARTAAWPEQVELIEAAYAEPLLRGLYPFTSHCALRLTATPERGPDLVCLWSSSTGAFKVSKTWNGPVYSEAANAVDAVAAAVRHLADHHGITPASRQEQDQIARG
jgi:hypothetical protein